MEENFLKLAGFPEMYINKYTDFYKPFFSNTEELNLFYQKVFSYDKENKVPRQIFNRIQQLVSIADDIDSIRPDRDPLRVLFLRSCIEAICILAGRPNDKISFFCNYFSEVGKEYILTSFKLLDIQLDNELDEFSEMKSENDIKKEMTLENFAELFRQIRNDVVHEGKYYEMQFWARDKESDWLTNYKSNEDIFKIYKKGYGTFIYCFETTMQYDKFRYYFIEACIRYLDKYLEKLTVKKNV